MEIVAHNTGSSTSDRASTRARARVPRLLAAFLLGAHAVVHLLGAVLLWHLGQPGTLRYDQVSPEPGTVAGLLVGAGWLFAAALFAATAIAVATHHRHTLAVATAAALLSVAVLAPSAAVAAAGLGIDAFVLLAVAIAVASR